MHYVFCSVDPGITGAFAVLSYDDSTGTTTCRAVGDLPVQYLKVRGRKRTIIDLQKLWPTISASLAPGEIFSGLFIEDVHAAPGQGVSSMFNFGKALGVVLGSFAAHGVHIRTIDPKQWQKIVAVEKSPEASLAKAREFFPEVAEKLALKKHHNRADALLIGLASTAILHRERQHIQKILSGAS